MIRQIPGKKNLAVPGWGVRIIQPAAAPLGGWWDNFGDPAIAACAWSAYQPKSAASLAASYTDLTGNGNNAGVGVAPTWDAVNGWKFDGLAQYLTTTFVPQNDQSQSVLAQFTTRTNNGFFFGENDAANRDFALQIIGSDARPRNGAAVVNPPGMVAGNYGIAGNQGYRNGAPDGGPIGGWTGPTAFTCYIGALNNGGVAAVFSAIYIQALAIYDCTLTALQMAAVAANMAAL